MSFSVKILKWYQENKRDLPWRGSRDPYKIWLSEIILQQTRVAQGTPYYFKFIEAFPTINDLANAKEEQILKLWQGLGYYSRARNLHTAAKMVVYENDGIFPGTYKELLKLKGVGDYTASAISSICFNERHAVVDGNVYRVLSRYFGIDIPINTTKGIRYFRNLAQEVLHPNNTRDYNQGIMEFGAIQCTPKKPNCYNCPLSNSCVALEKEKIKTLPVKVGKTKVRTRYFNYLVPITSNLENEKFTQLRQRKGKGIWQNLWEFPLWESEEEIEATEVEKLVLKKFNLDGLPEITLHNENPIVHKLSHQHLHTKFWIIEGDFKFKKRFKASDLKNYPVPVLIADFMKTFKF